MRKVIMSLTVLIMFVFLVGCLDYKAYDIPADQVPEEDISLLDEIAEIEEQLNLGEFEEESGEEDVVEELEELNEEFEEEELWVPEEIEEEVVLPLGEEMEDVADEDLETINVKENELVKLNAKVDDPDQDKVTYSFSKPLNKKGEWKTSYGDAGEYLVTLTATDGKLTTEKKVRIVVERVNVAPKVTGVKDIFVNEGEIVSFEPKVSDPNNDPVTVTISDPLRSGTFVTDHTSAGEYQVRVAASDGELETEKTFKLTVADVNVLPEISGLEDVTVKEGEIVNVKPTVTDLDEDKVTLTISEPVGNDGVWETAYTDHGEYAISVVADDGKDKVTEKVIVVVEDVNMPPEIVEVYLNLN